MTSKRDHERDAELDKKIEALRRKNEALMKRYKVRTSTPTHDNKRTLRQSFLVSFSRHYFFLKGFMCI